MFRIWDNKRKEWYIGSTGSKKHGQVFSSLGSAKQSLQGFCSSCNGIDMPKPFPEGGTDTQKQLWRDEYQNWRKLKQEFWKKNKHKDIETLFCGRFTIKYLKEKQK